MGKMMSMGKEREINSAQERTKASGGVKREAAAASGGNKHDHVGNETSADMKGALYGSPEDKNPLHGAVQELGRQHPHGHMDRDPHHGAMEHKRHMPLHGLAPKGHRK